MHISPTCGVSRKALTSINSPEQPHFTDEETEVTKEKETPPRLVGKLEDEGTKRSLYYVPGLKHRPYRHYLTQFSL